MADLTIRRTTAADYDELLRFYTAFIDETRGTEYDIMWEHDVHPSHAFLRESAERGHAIIGLAEGGEIASALVVNSECAPGYEKVPWAEPDLPLERVGIMHSVATRPHHMRKGYARQMVQAAADLSREAGLSTVRLDTLPFNERAHALYESCGFNRIGTYRIDYEELDPLDLIMFERVL